MAERSFLEQIRDVMTSTDRCGSITKMIFVKFPIMIFANLTGLLLNFI
jgi:hypothetical protein